MHANRSVLSLTLLITLSLSVAQSSTPSDKTGLAALPTPDGALLRWFLPGDVVPSGGFLVQIAGGSSLTVPVASPQPFTPALGISREEYDAVKAVYTAPLTDDNRLQRAIFNLNVVARTGYAKALGIQITLKDLKPGAYAATVYAVNGGNQTRVGSAAFTTGPTPAVPAPAALKATGGTTGAQLTWTPPNTPGNLVVAYNVYRAGTSGPFTRLDPAPFFRTEAKGGDVFKDTALKAGQTGRYQVTSVDLFGRESAPSPAITVTAQTMPVSPEITRASPGNRTVTLDWIPSTDARVTAVQVLRGTTPENLARIATVTSPARSYVDSTVQGGVAYLYALAAVDSQGVVSGRSTLTGGTGQNLTPPAAPSGLKVTPGESALALAWTANPERDLRGYLVYRSEGTQAAASELLLTGLPITALSYTDSIPKGVQTRYHYRVVAVNTTQVASVPSAAVTAALLDTTPPPAPVLAAVLPSTGTAGLTLTWTQAEVPDLAGFEVTRVAEGATLPPTVLNPAPLNAAARTYTDASAAPGVIYAYSLRSLDRTGNRSQPAAPVVAALPGQVGGTLPTALTATLLPEHAGVRLRWAAGSSAAQYVVYRLAGTQPLQVSDLLSEQTFTDPQGQADSQYLLRAVSGSGELSAPTPVLRVTP
ncbi:fibronectin type III domain-containing protein [Deinococcus altitudinis]|uniref:fibronectin type III domain-containing protein n=1 Tax=Deinococcus altitudinis TaxID=468914 RepID=UPI00389278E1